MYGWHVGSSPLARGLRAQPSDSFRSDRIIPARAGFTDGRRSVTGPRGDHPRSRGVYRQQYRAYARSPGSSPLARGLRIGAIIARADIRIIPARAGFTACFMLSVKSHGDHPRSRGVYRLRTKMREIMPGSSPLARGLPMADDDKDVGTGIIPARAGFTDRRGSGGHGLADHPRSRGVYSPLTGRMRRTSGSSPLARGLRPWEASHSPQARIIPARAGFTTAKGRRPSTCRDHPRSRGVYSPP